MKRVAIVQPWVANYRVPFFQGLREVARPEGVEIDIFHGSAKGELARRGDSVENDAFIKLPTQVFPVFHNELYYKSLRKYYRRNRYDLTIVEQAVRNLETYEMLLRPNSDSLALWGHGRTYTKPIGPRQEQLKNWLTLRSDWFFAYTEGGARSVREIGYPDNQITVVQNAIDSRGLATAVRNSRDDEVEKLIHEFDLRGKTALFIGGLDSSKRLEFLLQASRQAHYKDPDFRLIVGGAGSDVELIEKASVENPWIAYVGPVHGNRKAILMKACQVLSMPGRVGLVSVDSFAAQLPVVTTDWPWHAPEFEYLINGKNSVISHDSIDEYAESLLAAMEPQVLTRLSKGCKESCDKYSMNAMVGNFYGGIEDALRQNGQRLTRSQ